MRQSEFKPEIPRKKPMQTYTLNRSATEIGLANMEFCNSICADLIM
jgi:hypothetical protein